MYAIFRIKRTEEEWLSDSGSVFLTWNIFNPNGPTINCMGVRQCGHDGQQEVFWRWMHFTGGEDYCLGYIGDPSSDYGVELEKIITNAFVRGIPRAARFPSLTTCIPYFVTCSMGDPWHPVIRDLIANARAEDDWGRDLYRIRKFGPNLFDRAGEEYREIYESCTKSDDPEVANSEYLKILSLMHRHRPTWQAWQPDAYASRSKRDGDAEEWWNLVTAPEYTTVASGQFAQAWVGASWMAPERREMTITTFDTASRFLQRYGHPLWPEEWTEDVIAKAMGLSGS